MRPTAIPDLLERFRPWKRQFELGFWAVMLGVQTFFNAVVTWLDLKRALVPVAAWEPALWELSSALVIGALIPLLVRFERWKPVRLDTLPRCLGWHLLGSVAFSLLHVAGMVLLRKLAYATIGETYAPRSWLTMIGYEYLKDIRTYLMILVAVWSYRFVLLRLHGEARLLDVQEPPAGYAAPQASTETPPPRPERFLVRKLRKEFLVAAADIEHLHAEANYVGLRVNGHDYLLRSTLSDFLEQLDPARFVRVHRSYAVNLDRVASIEPREGGDAMIQMKDGSEVPCSRRYRDALPKRS